MLIAGFKATLVAFFFMHLWYDNKLYFLIFASSLAFLAVFIGLTMFDTQRRAEIDQIKGHPIEPKAIILSETHRLRRCMTAPRPTRPRQILPKPS